jgi:5'-methylthioadenosine phosphorylase
MNMSETIDLAIIGGTGLQKFAGLTDVETREVQTPFGTPSSPIVIGSLSGRRVAFLSRHGIGHHITPSEVNYRANIYALKALGATRVVSISACGSLREDYAPGHIVIPDQLVDFTKNRIRTYFGEGLVGHVGTADPYCSELSTAAFTAVEQTGAIVHRGGAFIVIEGPRFSTKAESQLFRSWGMSIIGMTACPEAFLAREAELCYTTMAHVTDYDVWHVSEAPVTVEMVVRTLNKNTEIAQQAIHNLVASLPTANSCACQNSLANALMTDFRVVPPETKRKLGLLVSKYLHE